MINNFNICYCVRKLGRPHVCVHMVLQPCYNHATTLLQPCYNHVTTLVEIINKLQNVPYVMHVYVYDVPQY